MRTYTQTTLTHKKHTPVQRRRSGLPNDKRRNPKDKEIKGSHLGTSEAWRQAVTTFLEEKDYYVNQYKQRKYIDNKIIYQLAVTEVGEQRRQRDMDKGFKLTIHEC